MTSRAVVVTGIGAASALGTGIEAHRAALWGGRDGFRQVDRFDTAQMTTHLAATWPGWDGRTQLEPAEGRDLAATAETFPLHELALVAAREAWSMSGASAGPHALREPRRAALVFGTCYGHGFKEFSPVAERIANGLDLAGPCITISTACASSTNAIGLARDLLLHGHADLVVAGGADALLREALAGFSALGVLSAEPCAPFSDPPGTSLGEGAAFLILERAEDAARRKAFSWASIAGYGLSADAFHETTPDPMGAGLSRAIRGALDDAGWRASDVDYVNAHATGTANNDRIEWSVIGRDIGPSVRVSGSKGHIGHTQGAAGALELVLGLICHREGHVPPTLHFRGARSGCPSDPIAGSEPQPMAVSRALKLSAAFGGANAVLAYDCGAIEARPTRTRSPVVIAGASVVGPAGALRLSNILELTSKQSVGACREVDLDSLGVDARRLDRSARWLTAAAALSLSREGRREALDRTGLFVAAARMSEESSRRCMESIRQRGIAGTSASAFARMSVNAPTGACAQALGLLGPTSTFSSGESSGLLALVLASEWLTWREDTRGIVAGSVDERSVSNATDQAEGAACVALVRSPSPQAGVVVVAGWAIAGPDGAEDAAARAMTSARLARVDGIVTLVGDATAFKNCLSPSSALGLIDGTSLFGAAEATRSCVMATVAAAHIAAGNARSILVVAGRGATSVALVLERAGDR